MLAAARVKGRVARGTMVRALEILCNRKLGPAGAAKHRALCPLLAWPQLARVISKRIVTVLAREERATAPHLNSDDVEHRIVVGTAGLRIHSDPAHLGQHHSRSRALLASKAVSLQACNPKATVRDDGDSYRKFGTIRAESSNTECIHA